MSMNSRGSLLNRSSLEEASFVDKSIDVLQTDPSFIDKLANATRCLKKGF